MKYIEFTVEETYDGANYVSVKITRIINEGIHKYHIWYKASADTSWTKHDSGFAVSYNISLTVGSYFVKVQTEELSPRVLQSFDDAPMENVIVRKNTTGDYTGTFQTASIASGTYAIFDDSDHSVKTYISAVKKTELRDKVYSDELRALTSAGLKLYNDDAEGIVIADGTTPAVTLTGNLVMGASKTVDGIDVSTHAHTAAAGHGVKISITGATTGTLTVARGGTNTATFGAAQDEMLLKYDDDTASIVSSGKTITDFPAIATFNDHSARHENGGADEISVLNLSGLLSDAQTPLAHNQSAATITTGVLAIAQGGTNASSWTASRVLVSTAGGALGVAAITTTELDYLNNVSSNIQTQLNGKAPSSEGVTNGDSHDHVGGDGASISLTTAVTGVLPIANGGTGSSSQTAGRAVVTDGSGKLVSSANITITELDYLNGVSSAIQTQLNGKSPSAGSTNIVTVGTVTTGIWNAGAITTTGKVIAHGDISVDSGDLIRLTGSIGTSVIKYESNEVVIKRGGASKLQIGVATTTLTNDIITTGYMNAVTYKVNGAAGANFSGAVTNITVVDGLVTAAS